MIGCAGGDGPGPRDVLPPGACTPAVPPDTNPPASSETAAGGSGPLRRVIRIVNPLGLHQRIADRFSRTARKFSCTVSVWNGSTRADGKDIWALIMLVALPESEVVLEVDGADAAHAAEALAAILASPGGEDYTI
ncbi:HPr family phosphocarrier protein [Gemmata sp. JC717]|uniref:HPr family phosphocarrier protein n=1 Tax=Gemmata algarum TaxID=2975278 RepID=A0ABU5F2L8_9BACT|nr:HPr family phosphocarrier protein [Gemmata algarum]MDY3551707.1 HPr family phosphocarrier protein [Gemmata algarum]MDY3561744.1 HPr family phosphocarrier protein [Gemmata algarum]